MLLYSLVSITILRYVKEHYKIRVIYYNFYEYIVWDIFINVRDIFETMFNYKNIILYRARSFAIENMTKLNSEKCTNKNYSKFNSAPVWNTVLCIDMSIL